MLKETHGNGTYQIYNQLFVISRDRSSILKTYLRDPKHISEIYVFNGK